MALEAYLDSNGQFALPLVASSRGTGVLLESLGSSILLQSDGLSDVAAASHLDMSSGKLSDSIASMARLSGNLVSGTRYSGVLNSGTNSGRSVGASSLVTDANSPLAGGAHLRSSGSGNMDPYHNLPSSPLSFSSNALSTSVLDASSIVQLKPSYREEQNSQLGQKRLLPQYQVGSTGTPHTASQAHQVSLPMGKNQEPAITQIYKKPRLDINPENILHQEIIQQLLQKQDSVQLQDHSQQLLALMQQHKLRNQQQQQILQSIPQLLGVPAQAQQQQQQQRQMRQHLQQHANHHVPAVHLDDGGICSRRLMQYIYHLRHRPPDNSIAYWKKFVAEYFAPGAKKRWCLSLYDSIGEHALGVFSQAAMEAWHCDICGSKSGKGFEAIFEILPRLSKIKFESGVIDELLFLDFPHECRFPSGVMMLSYGKAVQESVYEQFRVVREGQLRIIFSRDLKILSWEFCARHHEELVPRRLVSPQVNQLVQAAKKYLSSTKDGGFDGVSPRDLQLNCNMFLTAGRQLTRNLDLLLVNDLGFSKRYVRCLQIAEVVNSMKDLMTFSHDNNIGPMESLRKYGRKETKTNKQMKQMLGMEWLASAKSIPTDANKGVAVFPEPPSPSSNGNESSSMTKGGIMCSSEEVALAGMNEYHKLLRKNATSWTVKQEPSCSINCCSQIAIPLPAVGCPQSSSSGLIQNSPISDSSTSHPSQGSDSQQHLINKLLQEMVANSSRAKGGLIANGKAKEEALLEQDNRSAVGEFSAKAIGKGTFVRSVLDSKLGRKDCFQAAASNSNSSAIYGNNVSVKSESDFLEMLHLHEAVQNIDHGFFKDGAFDDDWKDKGWKT